MTLPVAILAGGLATRLGTLTKTTPKSLIQVAGKPFIDWQLDYLKTQGIQRVVLCVGYLGEQIQAHLANGRDQDLELLFSSDGSSPLGTGGALKHALPFLGEAFFLLYGDSYLPISLRELEDAFHRQDNPGLMTLLKNKNQWDTSNVWFEKGMLLEYNKQTPNVNMAFIDCGLSILSASMLINYPMHDSFDLANLYHDYSLEGAFLGQEVFSRFYEIGSIQGLQETTVFLSTQLGCR